MHTLCGKRKNKHNSSIGEDAVYFKLLVNNKYFCLYVGHIYNIIRILWKTGTQNPHKTNPPNPPDHSKANQTSKNNNHPSTSAIGFQWRHLHGLHLCRSCSKYFCPSTWLISMLRTLIRCSIRLVHSPWFQGLLSKVWSLLPMCSVPYCHCYLSWRSCGTNVKNRKATSIYSDGWAPKSFLSSGTSWISIWQ